MTEGPVTYNVSFTLRCGFATIRVHKLRKIAIAYARTVHQITRYNFLSITLSIKPAQDKNIRWHV